MLLDKGDYPASITKFKNAHAKGPNFADPLEMWGEALIAMHHPERALVTSGSGQTSSAHDPLTGTGRI